jgi:hypothetical protein
MKTFLLLLISLLAVPFYSQSTARNFTASDCSANSHDLHAELSAGNVVVICWVMPCAACAGPAKSAHDIAKSYATSHPGKVRFYLCDDYANTSCATLNNWAASIGITDYTAFSSNKVKMTDFGAAGMPKTIIVSGGSCPLVYFDQNNGLNSLSFTSAMNTALSATTGPAYSPSAVNTTVTAAMSTVTTSHFYLSNNGSAKIALRLQPVSDSLPASWMYSLCVNGSCTAAIPSGTLSIDSLAAGQTATVSLSVDPGAETGSGKVSVFVYQNGFRPCGDTLTWDFNTGTVGLGEMNEVQAHILYPNPAGETLHIGLPARSEVRCVFADITGRQVLSTLATGKENTVDLSALAPGVYFVTVNSGNRIYHARFVRE